MPKQQRQKSQAAPLRRRPVTRSQTRAQAASSPRVLLSETVPATEHSVAEPDRAGSTPTTAAAAPTPAPIAHNPSRPPDPPAAPEVNKAWVSRVGAGITINMTRARAEYKLTNKDLKDLTFSTEKWPVKDFIVDMTLYQERDVERVAWAKYGGPEGLMARLDVLRKRHAARNYKTPFKCPTAYRPGSSARLAGPSNPAGSSDRHVMGSHILADIKGAMVPWLWEACNASLDAFAAIQDDGRGFYRYEREDAMQAACRGFVERYPPRPDTPLDPSPAVDALRIVLDQAPQLPPRPEWGTKKFDGLVYNGGSPPDEEESYEWDETYLGRLFHALHGIIRAHGRGNRGWATARWEVYETYKARMWCGVSYIVQLNDRSWDDGAAKWLRDDYLDVGLSKYCGARSAATSGSSRPQRVG